MSTANTPAFFDCCRAGVAELIDAGAGMDVIERTIDAYALDPDEQDALWLWARGPHDRLIRDRFDRQIVGRQARAEWCPNDDPISKERLT